MATNYGNKHYVNEVGTKIRVETTFDELDAATKTDLKIIKPSGKKVTWGGSVEGTEITHTIQSGELDEVGMYMLQAYIETPQGKWHGETTHFEIYDTFE